MIPVRIEVEGFLCYRDKQVIDLEGRDLWVFSGRNGSGKSAIFDAMTYALFKAHRGGKRGAANLIHSDAPGFTIAFEFDLGEERYRLRRSLRRATNKAERQLFRRGGEGDASWPAVPETESDENLDVWIAANIGLSFETFTSSVLLMQGKAERLNGESASGRHKIVAGIVALEKYQQLHKVADRKRLRRQAEADAARSSLANEPEVGATEIEEAERTTAEADRALVEAEEDRRRHDKAREQANNWRGLVASRDEAIVRRDHAREVLDNSESIGRDWLRLKSLDAALPALREAPALRDRIDRHDREAARLRGDLADSSRKLDLTTTLCDDNRKHLESISAEIAVDQARKSAISERGEELREAVARAKAVRGHREVLAGLDRQIAAHPDDLPARVDALEAEIRVGGQWKTALPTLMNLAKDRAALSGALASVASLRRTLGEGRAGLPPIQAECEARQAEVRAADAVERSARDRNTEETTLRDAQARRIDQFRALRDAPSCDRCGQSLTREHFQDEAGRMEEEARQLAQTVEEAGRDLRHSSERLAAARASSSTADAELETASGAVDRATRDLQGAEAEVRDRVGRCRDAYDTLDDAFRLRISARAPDDWPSTTFPENDHLAEGRRRAAEIAPAQDRLNRLRADLDAVRSLRSRRDAESEALERIVFQAGDEDAEAERNVLADEDRRLQACLEGHAVQKDLAESTRDLLADQIKATSSRRAEADKGLALAEAEAWNARERQARARSALPETWRDDFDRVNAPRIAGWGAEADGLRARGVEALADELPRAQIEHARSRSQVDDLDLRIAEIPEVSRLAPDVTSSRTAAADARRERAEAGRREARSQVDDLRRRQARRERLAAESLAADASLAVADTLAALLGRRELQRHLLREAERGIIDRANPILGEVSGGELQLRLLDGDGDSDEALRMEALVRAHGRTHPHDVAFLSGGQKFRVAVSLALAIGQYARGRKERPIESVVIDEGFGCLDRQGRDEMIAQLKALRGRLARIILVSHQEDFADAFDDGYRFAIIDGATVVEPVHR